jgi:hypothetical protein
LRNFIQRIMHKLERQDETAQKISCMYLQWNPGNMTNHGTDVGWSWYQGGRVSEVESLGVNFPPKTAYRTCSIACLHAWLRWCTKPFSWQKQLLLGKRLLKCHNRVYNSSWKKITQVS